MTCPCPFTACDHTVCLVIFQTVASLLSGRELVTCCLKSGHIAGSLAPRSQMSDELAPEALTEQGARKTMHAGWESPSQGSGCEEFSLPLTGLALPLLLPQECPLGSSKPITGGRHRHQSEQCSPAQHIRPGSQLLVPVPHTQLPLLAWHPVFPKCWGSTVYGKLCLHSCWFIFIFFHLEETIVPSKSRLWVSLPYSTPPAV